MRGRMEIESTRGSFISKQEEFGVQFNLRDTSLAPGSGRRQCKMIVSVYGDLGNYYQISFLVFLCETVALYLSLHSLHLLMQS